MTRRYPFIASIGKVQGVSSRRIEGLALPFGVKASEQHPSFEKGMLVHVPVDRPLFLEHDPRNVIGIVETLYEKDDGIYFIATLSSDVNVPEQVSVGGEYIMVDGKIDSLYIYEVSLTSTPAYRETYTKILANMDNVKVAFQEEELMTRLVLLEEQISALSAQVQELASRVEALESSMTAQATEASSADLSASLSELQKSLTLIRSVLQGNSAKTSKLESALLEMRSKLDADKKTLEEQIADFKEFVAASKQDFTELSAELVKLSENILKNIKV